MEAKAGSGETMTAMTVTVTTLALLYASLLEPGEQGAREGKCALSA